ncbi:MAG: uroporphyrinogen-III decarboxylase-like protein [Candidatus Sumerlaeota bacterium]|nr:uroporphyrinogen-III decarboxylase-like protein [Candidatus Sumerlaeota bacterium]
MPDFNNLLKVLRREEPTRATLFEFFLNQRLYEKLAGAVEPAADETLTHYRRAMRAYHRAGYDYVTVLASDFGFPKGEKRREKSLSQNEGACICDWETYLAYTWPDPDKADYSRLDAVARELPDGMKIVAYGPGGVLENAIDLVGYERLCMMILEDPQLAADIFEAIGLRLVRFYEIAAAFDSVGALIGNDDWGFRTQTVFAPEDMRRYVFPWHQKIVQAIHATSKPAILHSCGNLAAVMDDIIDVIRYDAKHSYEDAIQPVEEAYEQYHRRIAILGGIDVDFLCRSSPERIRERSRAMLERASGRGGYALGSGNSIPDYVPDEHYLAMISAAVDR